MQHVVNEWSTKYIQQSLTDGLSPRLFYYYFLFPQSFSATDPKSQYQLTSKYLQRSCALMFNFNKNFILNSLETSILTIKRSKLYGSVSKT